MAKCKGKYRDGADCHAEVKGDGEYCGRHDPDNAPARKHAGRKKTNDNRLDLLEARVLEQENEINQLKERLSKLELDVVPTARKPRSFSLTSLRKK